MILFDSVTHNFIELSDFQINNWHPQELFGQSDFSAVLLEVCISLNNSTDYFNWVNSWITSIQDKSGRIQINNKSLRDLFLITENLDYKFIGSVPENLTYDQKKIILNFRCDYLQSGKKFQEITWFYRDLKIEKILE